MWTALSRLRGVAGTARLSGAGVRRRARAARAARRVGRVGGKPSVARSRRRPVGERQIERSRSARATASASARARRSSSSGSPIPKTRLAASVVGSSRAARARRRGAASRAAAHTAPRRPSSDEQLVAPDAREAGQREALEHPLEAPLAALQAASPVKARVACEPRLRARPTGGRRRSVREPRAGSCEVRGPSAHARRRSRQLAAPGAHRAAPRGCRRTDRAPRAGRGRRSGSTIHVARSRSSPASARASRV